MERKGLCDRAKHTLVPVRLSREVGYLLYDEKVKSSARFSTELSSYILGIQDW